MKHVLFSLQVFILLKYVYLPMKLILPPPPLPPPPLVVSCGQVRVIRTAFKTFKPAGMRNPAPGLDVLTAIEKGRTKRVLKTRHFKNFSTDTFKCCIVHVLHQQ